MANVGDFFANMLLGGLQEGQQRRERRGNLQDEITKAVLLNRLDPEKQLKAQLFSRLLGQTGQDSSIAGLTPDAVIRSLLGFPETTLEISAKERAKKSAELEAERQAAASDPLKHAELELKQEQVKLERDKQRRVHQSLFGRLRALPSEESLPTSSEDQFQRDMRNALTAIQQGKNPGAVREKLLSRHRNRQSQIDPIFNSITQ